MKYAGLLLLSLLLTIPAGPASAQVCCDPGKSPVQPSPFTAFDTLLASRIEVLQLPGHYRYRSLPPAVDNSLLPYFPGVCSQYSYFSCQQYSGITFAFGYEMNRLRNVPANLPKNRYPAHYTWNFLNFGGQHIGVNFLHSFYGMMEQGHMTSSEYGSDTAYHYLGWPSGYERYEKAFPNRVRAVRSIPVSTPEGILTLKHYIHDHLEEAASGGVACFSSALPYTLQVIPDSTPEAGKHVLLEWMPWATHGMTIVGYNDSIRYDINEDGQFTNDLDITGDGEVNLKDWEIGAFKFANSYGTWWGDGGYCYALYRSFGCLFEHGGIWNNAVYVVEADTAYEPLLGMEFTLQYNKRSQLRFMAGVSSDTSAHFPAHTMDFPYFNFQGNAHAMQGYDSIAGQEEIELGLDITPLLAYTVPGQPARFFFIVEEDDPYGLGSGMVKNLVFHNYTGSGTTFSSEETDVPITDHGTTYLSATGTVSYSPVQITTTTLPDCTPGQPWSAQLDAAGGTEPYKWSLVEQYRRSPADSGFTGVENTYLWEESDEIPYARVVLPFSFPYFGKNYDTVYMNSRGMLQFTPDHLPFPYLIGWDVMIRNYSMIVPAFSWYHRLKYSDGDGMWVRVEPSRVTFRWKISLQFHESTSDLSFELVLLPDGSFEFHYGDCISTSYPDRILAGYSKGDNINFGIIPTDDLTSLSGRSFRYTPAEYPDGISLSEEGLLTLDNPDAEQIADIRVRVTDERLLKAEKTFQLSSGLQISPTLSDPTGLAHFGETESVDLSVKNTGILPLGNLQMSLRCSDSSVIITDSTENIASLGAGELTSIEGAFAFQLADHPVDQTVLYFTLDASSSPKNWQYTFPVTVAAPNLVLKKYSFHDGVNNLPDPGETADLEIEIANFGTCDADSLTIRGTSSDSNLVVLPPSFVDHGLLASNGLATLSLRVKASRYAPAGATSRITLELDAATGIHKQFDIDLQLGSKPVAIVSLTTATTSVQTMKDALDSIGASYDHYTWAGTHLYNYPVIFLILGTSTGSHFLEDDEGSLFAAYLRHGGKLYAESYAEWYYNTTELNSMLKFTTEKVPAYTYEAVSGIPGTFCDGLNYQYLGSTNWAMFDLQPETPAFTIMGAAETPEPHVLQIAYEGDDYKSILSMVEFGKLADSAYPLSRTELMQRYLDFFGVIYKGPFPYFHAEPTTVCRYHSVQFIDDSYENVQSWHWEFPGGEPSSSDLQQPLVTYPAEGVYDVTLTVSDGLTSHTLTRKEFIRAEVCAGKEEHAVLSEVVVYPNPAREVVNVILPAGLGTVAEAVLIDLTGRGIRRAALVPSGNGTASAFSVAGIPEGMYLLRITCGGEAVTKKLIIRH